MDTFFKFSERGSNAATEVRAGLTTFLAMAYIIIVNPSILSSAGINPTAAVTATCLGAAVMTIAMGVFSNRPLACASGMGINSIVAFTLCGSMGLGWQTAMAVIFVEGVAILFLVLCGLREAIMEAIPVPLRHGISIGLGLFIAMIGLKDGGVIVANADTMVSLGSLLNADGGYNFALLVGIISIVLTVVLYSMKVKGALLWGIVISAIIGVPLGVTSLPTGVVAPLDFSTFAAPFQVSEASNVMGIVEAITTPSLLLFAFSLMMSDFFDTMGTAMAVAKQGDFLTEDGKVEDIKPILIVDSAAAIAGGFVGASSITTFVESASGAADGGRTGLTSVVAGVLFLLAAFFSPLINCIPSAATCGALVFVGFLMMSDVADIDWANPIEAFPAFMIIAGIPFTYSISNGIGLGFITFVVVSVVTGNIRKVRPLMWVAAAAFLVYFIMTIM